MKRYVHIIILIGILVFIFYQSALPADISSEESNYFALWLSEHFHIALDYATFFVRKMAHFIEYAILGSSLIVVIIDNVSTRKMWMQLVWAWIIGVFYAGTDEIHQMFVPGRSCELRDILIDGMGVFCGILVLRLARLKREKVC